MKPAPRAIQWRQGQVDRANEHFELRYGSAKERDWGEWTPAALIGRPADGVLIVQFLIERADRTNAHIRNAAKKDLQFMCELNESDHWKYFKYHCTTTSNLYGNVHWSFFDPENKRSRPVENRENTQLKLFENSSSVQTHNKPIIKVASKVSLKQATVAKSRSVAEPPKKGPHLC